MFFETADATEVRAGVKRRRHVRRQGGGSDSKSRPAPTLQIRKVEQRVAAKRPRQAAAPTSEEKDNFCLIAAAAVADGVDRYAKTVARFDEMEVTAPEVNGAEAEMPRLPLTRPTLPQFCVDKADAAATAEANEVTRTEAAEAKAAAYKTQVHWRTLTLVERMQTRPGYRDKYRLEFSEPYNGRQEFDDVHSSIRRLDDTTSSDSDSDTDYASRRRRSWLFHNLRDNDFRILW